MEAVSSVYRFQQNRCLPIFTWRRKKIRLKTDRQSRIKKEISNIRPSPNAFREERFCVCVCLSLLLLILVEHHETCQNRICTYKHVTIQNPHVSTDINFPKFTTSRCNSIRQYFFFAMTVLICFSLYAYKTGTVAHRDGTAPKQSDKQFYSGTKYQCVPLCFCEV
jgi:hypothetical protein